MVGNDDIDSRPSPSIRSVESAKMNVSPQAQELSTNQPSWLTPSKDKESVFDMESNGNNLRPYSSFDSRKSTVRVAVESKEDTCCGCCPSDPILYWFRIFHSLSGLVGIATGVINAYVISRSRSMDFFSVALHIYTIVLCGIIVLVELDWRFFISYVQILDSWVFRGLFYGFIGVLTGEDLAEWSLQTTPIIIVGSAQAVFGAMYILMGIACVKGIEQRRSLHRSSPHYIEIPGEVAPTASMRSSC